MLSVKQRLCQHLYLSSKRYFSTQNFQSDSSSLIPRRMSYNEVIQFWFKEIQPKSWFYKDPAFDETLKTRFMSDIKRARAGELWEWRSSPLGRLAEIILLDQFSRNVFRDTPDAFSHDPMALALAQEAVHCGDDKKVEYIYRNFFYMPYMHSESAAVHVEGERLFAQNYEEHKENVDVNDSFHKFEVLHKDIIDKYGRYPHRNAILGRESTPDEIEFLQQPNSSF